MLNIVSSTLWIQYSIEITDMPIMIRGSSDLVLFSLSSIYIISNKLQGSTQVLPT
jgi:hypothetical protein